MAPDDIDIELPRNGHWVRTFVIDDAQDGVTPTDITNDSFFLDVRSMAGSAQLLGSATITKTDAPNGVLQVVLAGPDFDSFGSQFEIVRMAHDFRRQFPDGTSEVPFRGQILLYPEVSK